MNKKEASDAINKKARILAEKYGITVVKETAQATNEKMPNLIPKM